MVQARPFNSNELNHREAHRPTKARLFDGNATYTQVVKIPNHQPNPNRFHNIGDTGPFQIDSNLGFPAVVAEFLLQSHAGVVHILPALPPQLPTGSVSGIIARGGFVVSMSWDDGNLIDASIKSERGGTLSLKVANGKAFKVNGQSVETIKTTAGSTYKIVLG